MVAVCLSVWIVRASTPIAEVQSDTGQWDLRTADFEKTAVRFSGSVEYISGELLTPAEFDERSDEAICLDTAGIDSRFGTSRITLLVPEGSNYTISESAPLTSDRIFINGVWMEDLGIPGTTPETTTNGNAFVYYTVQPQGGVIEIVQQVSNFSFRTTERQAGYVLGTPEMMRSFIARDFGTTGSLMGSYAALVLVHLVLWLLFRKYWANLYCALFSLVWFFRGAVTGPNIALAMFPGIPWALSLQVEYLTVPIAVPLFLMVIRALFPRVIQNWFFIATIIASALFTGIVLFADSLTMSFAVLGYQAVLLLIVSYITIRLVQKIRKVDLSQALVLIGGAIFMYTAVRDILFYNGIFIFPAGVYSNDPLAQVGLLLLVYLLMAAMLLNTLREMQRNRENEQRLAAENALLDHSNTVRNDLINTISHETMTPLAVLSGYADIVAMDLREKGVDEQHAADLDMISTEAQHIAELMQSLQEMARAKDANSEKRELNFAEVIQQAARLYEHILSRRKTRLVIDVPADLPLVYGNAAGLTQVIFNLLSNAEKHTENGEVVLKARQEGDLLAVWVTDTGTGINPGFLPHAFEWRAHDDPEGTGLGLNLVKQIIDMHDGEIELESELAKGTSVRFTLPLYRGE
jgi:signal transduction histidine kinase